MPRVRVQIGLPDLLQYFLEPLRFHIVSFLIHPTDELRGDAVATREAPVERTPDDIRYSVPIPGIDIDHVFLSCAVATPIPMLADLALSRKSGNQLYRGSSIQADH